MDALNFCKLEIAFKYQTKLFNSFHFKDPLPKALYLALFLNFSVVFAMSPIMAKVSYT